MGASAEHVDLAIEGMTCAACAGRIERRLNRLDGVTATVNYATKTANVDFDPSRAEATALIEAVEDVGYHAALPGAEAPAHDALGLRLVVGVVLALPVVVLAMVPRLQFPAWQWVSLALTSPIVAWCGWPIHRATWVNLRHRAVTMDTLISVGTLAAYAWSVVAMLALGAGSPDLRIEGGLRLGVGDEAELYLEVAAAVTVLILLGRWLEHRATRLAGSAIRSLLELSAQEVWVIREGREVRAPASELLPGDRFVVRPGERVATDGVVEEGASAIDRSIVTGESIPVDAGPGDEVTGATINTFGRLVVRATRVGSDTTLAQITRLVTAAQAGKAPIQRLADRVSRVFVPVVIAVALLTLVGWLISDRSVEFAFGAAVSVLIIACPCALGLATPAAIMAGTGRGAQLGIFFRDPATLERTRRIDTVVIDKTGTLTEGAPRITQVTPTDGASVAEVLRRAGAVEQGSEHPVGRAVVALALDTLGELPAVADFRNLPGQGVAGSVDGDLVEVGRRDGAIAVTWSGRVQATLTVEDALKPTARLAIDGFQELGLTPVMLTGDSAAAADRAAAELGIGRVVAEVMPDEKAAVVADLQADGRAVAMIGDGVNDAPALAQADLGMAIGTGTDVAIEASDITLTSGDPRTAVDAIRLARQTFRTIRSNLFWAFAYNIAAIPLAVAGLLNPIVAAAAMALSSVFVVANSLRLRSFTTS